MSTSIEKKHDDGVENEEPEKSIEDRDSSFNAIINNAKDSIDEDKYMEKKEHHDECFTILGELGWPKVNESEERRIIILLPVDLLFLGYFYRLHNRELIFNLVRL